MRGYLPSAICILLCGFVLCGNIRGQVRADTLATVHGKVMQTSISAKSEIPLYGAVVILVNDIKGKSDTLRTVTNVNGEFLFLNVRPRPSFLSVSYVGFKPEEGEYELVPGNNYCLFTLFKSVEELAPSKVRAEVPLSRRIGDTTVFNAAAVQMMEGENLRDLLSKLPGFEISSDKIRVDGEEVKRTYVNGILLFGDKAITAANTLNADEVSQVRVYDESTPEDKVRGLRNTRKQRVLDIITKEAMMSFSEALLSASGGIDDTGQARYTGIASVAFYSEMMSFDAMGVLDNTSQGLGVVMGASPSSVRFFQIHQSGQLSSYQEDAVAAASFRKYWGSRDFGSNLSIDYKYRNKYERNGTVRHENHFLADGSEGRTSRDTLISNSSSGEHTLKLDFTLRKTPTRSLYGSITGCFDDASSQSRNAGMNRVGNITETKNELMLSVREGHSLSAYFNFRDYCSRKFGFSSGLKLMHSRHSNPFERLDTLASSTVRMRVLSEGVDMSSSASLSVSGEWVPVNSMSKTLKVAGAIDFGWNRDLISQESTDMISGVPVTSLSETSDYFLEHYGPEFTLTTQYTTSTVDLTAGVKAEIPVLYLQERFPAFMEEKKVYPGAVPSLNLKWKEFKISIEGRNTLPTASQIRKRISDRNTFALVGGNPDIKPSNTLDIRLDWGKTYGMFSASTTLTQNLCWNSILSRMYYLEEDTVLSDWDGYKAKAGSMLYTFENSTSPSSVTSAAVRLSRMMARRKIKAGLTLRGSIGNSPVYFGQEYVVLNNSQMSADASFVWTPDKHWRLSLSPGIAWQEGTGGGGTVLSSSLNSSLNSSLSIKYGPSRCRASYNLSHIDYLTGRGVDVNRQILNVSLGYAFLKNALEVKLEGFDLLNAGSLYTMTLTPEVMTQIWTPTYGRRLMLTLSYYFRKSR